MKTVAGIFASPLAAANTAGELAASGMSLNQISVLYPGASEKQIHSLPTSDTEQPGVGSAIGGTVGAAVGIAGGFELGVGITALIPGVGPIIAAGIAGAALLGAAGFVGGVAAGKAADEDSNEGIPADELFFYEDALRQGKSLMLVLAKDHEETIRAQSLMRRNGAESLDAARRDWWIGLRDVEGEHYHALGRNFEADQDAYRAGFEAALRKDCRGQNPDAVTDCLKWWYPELWDTEPFRLGFERGQRYWAEVAARKEKALRA